MTEGGESDGKNDASVASIQADHVVPEAMLRLQRMIKAGVLSPGATITYKCMANNQSYEFAAELDVDGSLVNAKEVTAGGADTAPVVAPSDTVDSTPGKSAPSGNASDVSLGKVEEKVFSSPTAFAHAMYKRTATRLNPRSKRKPSINGWVDCTVNGKTLTDLRSIMLRGRRSAAAASASGTDAISKPAQSQGASLGNEKPSAAKSEKDEASPSSSKPAPGSPTDKSKPEICRIDKKSEQSDAKSVGKASDSSESKPEICVPSVERKADVDNRDADTTTATDPGVEKEEQPAPASPSPDLKPTDKVDGGTNDAEDDVALKKSTKLKKTSGKSIESPSPVPETKKRKRSATPQSHSNSGSASGDRQTKARSNKYRRRLIVDGGPGISTENLDPDTVEAVAVAAAAEKEEAIAARRTTRLAAGKIDKVDYNAASGVPSKPVTSAEPDESDGEFMGIEPVVDEPRKSRRRDAAEKEKQRTSRRQARKRASREQSPGRNGGDGTDIRGSKRGSRSGSRNGDSDGAKRGSSLGKDDVVENENVPDSGSGGTNSSDDLEGEANFAAVNVSDREDEKGWTILTLSGIANAVKRAGSTTPGVIASDMRKEKLLSNLDLTERDVVDKVNEVIGEIKRANSRHGENSDYAVGVNEVLSFFAADVCRLASGLPRPVYSTQRRIEYIDKRRTSMEKKKRRAKREFDEALNKLESEMEARRKADLDVAFATMNLKELERERQREADNKVKLQKEIKYVKAQDRDGRKRIERTKRLYSKLIQTAKDNDAPKVDLPTPAATTGGASSSKKPRVQKADSSKTADSNGTIGESITSDDDRMVIDGEPERARSSRPTAEVESSPPDPRRLAELERLRSLVRDRAREAAECQRICEIEYLKFMTLLEAKNKLDKELYMTKSSSHDYGQHGGSSAIPPSGPLSKTKDSARRGDKSGTSKHANGGSKGKGGTSKNGVAPNSGVKNSTKKVSRKDDKSRRKSSSKPTAATNA